MAAEKWIAQEDLVVAAEIRGRVEGDVEQGWRGKHRLSLGGGHGCTQADGCQCELQNPGASRIVPMGRRQSSASFWAASISSRFGEIGDGQAGTEYSRLLPQQRPQGKSDHHYLSAERGEADRAHPLLR